MGAHDSYTIDELAQAAGMTPRNVRAYRTKGLLSPPFRVGRRSRYRVAHLHRLRDIKQLREAGLPLKLIIDAAQRGEDLGPAGMLWQAAGFGTPHQGQGGEAGEGGEGGAAGGPERGPAPSPDSATSTGGSMPSIIVAPEAYALMRTLTNRGFEPATVMLLALRAARASNALAADLSLLLAEQAQSQAPQSIDLQPAKTAVIDLATIITREMLGHAL